jgi:hypothetical protein
MGHVIHIIEVALELAYHLAVMGATNNDIFIIRDAKPLNYFKIYAWSGVSDIGHYCGKKL